jgi:hypothetical protein
MSDKPLDWRDSNPIIRRFETLQLRTREVISGQCPLLIVYGPPGIAKSKEIMHQLRLLWEVEHEKWLNANPKPARRTAKQDDGRETFNEPYRIITGEISFPIFYCRMYWASRPGEVLFIDDVTSLSDRRIQSAMQQASDPTHNGAVRFGFKTAPPDELVPRKYSFEGGIIIVTNFRKDDANEGALLKQLFNPALLDRAKEVEFPWDEPALFEYVSRMAFGRDPEAGLYQYMLAETMAQNPSIGRDEEGLGFKGSSPETRHEEAIQMQKEVYEFLVANRERVRSMSFRTLRKWMSDRVNYPDKWQKLIEETLLPPTVKASAKDGAAGGGGRSHAYEERPLR